MTVAHRLLVTVCLLSCDEGVKKELPEPPLLPKYTTLTTDMTWLHNMHCLKGPISNGHSHELSSGSATSLKATNPSQRDAQVSLIACNSAPRSENRRPK